MKTLLLILCVLGFTLKTSSQTIDHYTYAKLYANSLGLKTKIDSDFKGNQKTVVQLPDGKEVGLIDFYLGKKGAEYSYCVKKGYKIKQRKAKYGYNIGLVPECVGDNGYRIDGPSPFFVGRSILR